MTFQIVLALLLVLHTTGITLMAGATVAHFSIIGGLNKYLQTDKGRALTVLEGSARLTSLMGLGGLLLILTGTGMVIELKSAVTQALWFKVKLPLVVLLVLNGTLLARPLGLRLQWLLALGSPDGPVRRIQSRLRLVYIVQFLLILCIFTLSIFKFG